MEELIDNSGKDRVIKSKLSTTGKILLGITGGTGVILTLLCAPFISPAFRKFCLPYVPATTNQVRNVLESLKSRRGKLLDVGSGDGRIVIEAAKHGFESDGVELNIFLVLFSRASALYNGVNKNTTFIHKDLWKCNLRPYNNIVIFGVEQMMGHLEDKILQEVGNGTAVVACRFPLPNLKPLNVTGSGVDTVWTYEIAQSSR